MLNKQSASQPGKIVEQYRKKCNDIFPTENFKKMQSIYLVCFGSSLKKRLGNLFKNLL